MKKWIFGILPVSAALLAVSCVKEYPEGPGTDPTQIETTIRLDAVPEFSHEGFGDDYVGMCMNFVVEIYKDKVEGEPLMRREVSAAHEADGSALGVVKERLHAGHYKVVAWSVCAMDGSGKGCMYSTDDLSDIDFIANHCGCTDMEACYESRFDLDLTDGEWNRTEEVSETMESPMGSLEIISTDVQAFFKEQAATRGEAVDWDDYRLEWHYGLYFPTGYNVLTGQPNAAETGVAFESEITQISDNEASLGFDYAFVNGDASKVTLSLYLYDRETGKLLNVYSDIEVPIERGETTTIRGEFLTHRQESGIGIDPDFDGSIDIVLPD